MANFNLAEYELVQDRVKKLYSLYEDARIVTENMSTKEDRERGHWIFKARVYLTQEDARLGLPKATGYAHEIDGGAGASRFSACENAETSAVGRCLANLGLHGDKRASRSEMEKVQRMEAAANAPKPEAWDKPLINWAEEIAKLDNADGARGLYALAKAENAPKAVLDEITAKGKSFTLEDK